MTEVLHTFCGMNQSHTLSTVQSVLGARASCLSSFPLELQTVVVLRCVDGVGSVGGSDDDRLPTTLHAIRERQKLGDDALLHFSVGLFTLGSNGVVSSMKTMAGAFFPAPLEGLAQIGLCLTSHL